jgi:hypothetical protein
MRFPTYLTLHRVYSTCWSEEESCRAVASLCVCPIMRHYRTWPHDAEMCGRRTEPCGDTLRLCATGTCICASLQVALYIPPMVALIQLLMPFLNSCVLRMSGNVATVLPRQWTMTTRQCFPSSSICQAVHQRQGDFAGAGGCHQTIGD